MQTPLPVIVLSAEMNHDKQRGISIIELMISITISLVILASASTFYVAAVRSSGATLKASKLNQELLTLLSVISSEVRRAGYTGQTTVVADPHLNFFNEVDVTALAVRASKASGGTAAASGECILFAYDADADTVIDNDELIGFRLNSGRVQMRIAGDTTANSRHDHCNDGDDTWQDLNDHRLVNISALTFDSSSSACINMREPDGTDDDGDGFIDNPEEADCYHADNVPAAGSGELTIETREINIALAGQLVGDSGVTVSVDQNVVVRNDLVRIR
jgi:prepilin peptidase dependent protein B